MSKSLVAYEKYLKEASKPVKKPLSVVTSELAAFNSILIENCIPGVTRVDLEESVLPTVKENKLVKSAEFSWVEGDKYLIIPQAHMTITRSVENELKLLVPTLRSILKIKFLANTVKLAKLDDTFKIVSVDEDSQRDSKEMAKVDDSNVDSLELKKPFDESVMYGF